MAFDFYKAFKERHADKASSLDVSLIEQLNTVSDDAYNHIIEIEKRCIVRMNAIIKDHYPDETLECVRMFPVCMDFKTPDAGSEIGFRTFPVRYREDSKGNGLYSKIILEDDLRGEFGDGLVSRKWGFDILHMTDFSTAVRELLQDMIEEMRDYEKIWLDCTDMRDTLIAKYFE